jgi:VIT1/CCC1 family predicted Fe2+/Mn2+ transporter
MSDGLMLPFMCCIVASFFTTDKITIALTGLASALLGATLFGLARYMGENEEIAHHHPQRSADDRARESELLARIGIDPALIEEMEARMVKEQEDWLQEVEEHNMGWNKPDSHRSRRAACETGLGFFTGGVLTCLPTLFWQLSPLLQSFPVLLAMLLFVVFALLKRKLLLAAPGFKVWAYPLRGLTLMLLIYFLFRLLQG